MHRDRHLHSPRHVLSSDCQSPLIDALFQRLHAKLKAELKFQKELVRLRGAVEVVMATSSLQRV